MDKQAKDALNLNERSDAELHAALRGFELKWQRKADRLGADERISRL